MLWRVGLWLTEDPQVTPPLILFELSDRNISTLIDAQGTKVCPFSYDKNTTVYNKETINDKGRLRLTGTQEIQESLLY